MLNRLIIVAFLLSVTLGTVLVSFPDGAAAILILLILTGLGLLIFRQFAHDREFITRVFVLAIAVRLAFGILVHVFDLRGFFGGDANTFDYRGNVIAEYWLGHLSGETWEVTRALSTASPGWGINYLVGFIYMLLGRNIFAAQCFCAVVGAATAPMVYFCADTIFENRRVARYSAIAAGFFPAMIIWSAQLLKDGLIVFLLVFSMTMVLRIQRRFNVVSVVLLVLAMFAVLSLRSYVFYMLVVAVVGSFIVGLSKSNKSIIARVALLIAVGFGLTYFGVMRFASADLDRYGDLKKVQTSRQDLAERAESGFSVETDVSTTGGAIAAIPLGFVVLMFAPFPWQFGSLRQAIAVPETILWWAMMPLMASGLLYALKNRLKTAMPVLLFALMLTLAYSIFQGNVGTAYRQRTQIQVFLFMFAAVGYVVRQERRVDKRLLAEARREHMERRRITMIEGRQQS